MHIEHLEECIVLSQTLNFTRAAEKLYMAQPVLSRHVSKLEGELGFKIFARTKHGMRVTRAGKSFLADAQRVVDDYHAMMGNLKSQPDTLQIGFVATTCSPYILEIQRKFKETLPQIEAQYHSLDRIWQPFRLLEDGTIDIAIGAILESPLNKKYRYHHLFDDEYFAVVNGNHPLAERSSVTPSELVQYSVLLPDERLVEQDDELKKALENAGPVDFRYSLHDVNSLPIMLASGDSVSIAMGVLAGYYPQTSNLVFIPIEGIDIALPVVTAWNEESENDALLALVDIVDDLFAARD